MINLSNSCSSAIATRRPNKFTITINYSVDLFLIGTLNFTHNFQQFDPQLPIHNEVFIYTIEVCIGISGNNLCQYQIYLSEPVVP